jgi:hypothetical protein
MNQAALIQMGIQLGLQIAGTIAKSVGSKSGATLDDVIAALELAKTKTAADYLAEDKAAPG